MNFLFLIGNNVSGRDRKTHESKLSLIQKNLTQKKRSLSLLSNPLYGGPLKSKKKVT